MAVYSGVHNRYPPLPEKQCRDQPHAGTRIMQQAQSGGQVGLVTGRKKGPRWLSWLWGHKRREGKGKTGHGPSPKVREHLQTVLDHTLPHQRLSWMHRALHYHPVGGACGESHAIGLGGASATGKPRVASGTGLQVSQEPPGAGG